MSLKANLVDKIKSYSGSVFTYSELMEYCRIWSVKISAAERRLREVTHVEEEGQPKKEPEIEIVTKKNYIVGWRMKGKQGRMW